MTLYNILGLYIANSSYRRQFYLLPMCAVHLENSLFSALHCGVVSNSRMPPSNRLVANWKFNSLALLIQINAINLNLFTNFHANLTHDWLRVAVFGLWLCTSHICVRDNDDEDNPRQWTVRTTICIKFSPQLSQWLWKSVINQINRPMINIKILSMPLLLWGNMKLNLIIIMFCARRVGG